MRVLVADAEFPDAEKFERPLLKAAGFSVVMSQCRTPEQVIAAAPCNLNILACDPYLPDTVWTNKISRVGHDELFCRIVHHPRVLLTLHSAFYSKESEDELRRKTAENVVSWAETGRPTYVLVEGSRGAKGS